MIDFIPKVVYISILCIHDCRLIQTNKSAHQHFCFYILSLHSTTGKLLYRGEIILSIDMVDIRSGSWNGTSAIYHACLRGLERPDINRVYETAFHHNSYYEGLCSFYCNCHICLQISFEWLLLINHNSYHERLRHGEMISDSWRLLSHRWMVSTWMFLIIRG